MKHGDVVVNVDNMYMAVFKGWVAGEVCSYIIYNGEKEEIFTGTTPELLLHCSKQIQEHNAKWNVRVL